MVLSSELRYLMNYLGVIVNYKDKQYAKPIIHGYIYRIDFTNSINWTEPEIPQYLSQEARKIWYGIVNVVPKNEETIQFWIKKVKRDKKQYKKCQFIGDYGNKFIISKSSIIHSEKNMLNIFNTEKKCWVYFLCSQT